MIGIALLGSGIGLGLWALAVWIVPPKPSLNTELARFTTPPSGATSARGLAAPAIDVLRAVGLPTSAIARDLAVVERPVNDYLTEKAGLTLAGLLIPPTIAAALLTLGVDLGPRIPGIAALGLAAIGFVAPDHRIRRQAARRRADFRHALSAFLDLVVISLAGGAGVDSAVHDAAHVGHGWAFTQIQRALTTARLTRTTPWDNLRRLGRDLDIAELAELAASVSLAGTEGAKVRQSLQAKASALRTRQLTDAEAHASSDTERMSIPVMALFLGFLCFITYPAVSQVLNGL